MEWQNDPKHRRRNRGCSGCSCTHNIQLVGADMAFFRPKRRKQAFIGRQNKRPSSAVLLPDAVARWRGRRALLQSPFGRHEVNIAEKRLPSAIHITGRCFTHVFGQCIVCCIAFRLLYRIIVICSRFCWCMYIVLILDCVGYFHRPKKPLIQSRYTHISECFLLARLRRRIKCIMHPQYSETNTPFHHA